MGVAVRSLGPAYAQNAFKWIVRRFKRFVRGGRGHDAVPTIVGVHKICHAHLTGCQGLGLVKHLV